MNILATFCDNEVESKDYKDRPTVKAVIINDNDEVLLFAGGLPGGGVEMTETNEEALTRELLEEIGATLEIVRELGNVIAYRDELKLKYIFTGYECSLVSLGNPTTSLRDEIGKSVAWEQRIDLISRFENEIFETKKSRENFDTETYQRKVFNREAAILFLKQIEK